MNSNLQAAAQKACKEISVLFRPVPIDGRFHYLDADEKASHNGAGRIKFFPDGSGGMAWNHTKDDGYRLFWANNDQTLTPSEIAERKQRAKEERERAEHELTGARQRAAKLAHEVWTSSEPPAGNPYLLRKMVEPTYTLRQIKIDTLVKIIGYHPKVKGNPLTGEWVLIVPVKNDKNISTIEMIDEDGRKSALADGKKKGCFWATGKLSREDSANLVIGIGEGVATMLTYHQATGYSGIAALTCTNLTIVAKFFRHKYPNAKIHIISDVGNGEQAALEAARYTSSLIVRPLLPEGSTGNDINDLFTESGLEAVRACIDAADMERPAPCAESSSQAENEILEPDAWPILSEHALPGWLGEFVTIACEHSEADQAAVLITLLCRFAAEVGPGAYVNVGDARHRGRTNAVIVGASSKSRKGTSVKPIERLFNSIPSGARCTPGPLSSGEGLIYAVRDEVTEFNKTKQEHVVSDPGITDKRLFVLDEEFAAALNCTKREGNTLSAIIRGFFDDGNAEPLTKSCRIKATGAHVVIVTHITELELVSLLNQVQMTNGFGNRFLWILSRRQKLLALPSPMPDSEVDRIRKIVIGRLKSASAIGAVEMNDDAKRLWTASYPGLTMDYAGAAGAVVNRTEAHAIRLALIYALCAGHNQIEVDDLKAAIALVDYSRRSAFRIFGSVPQDKKKSKILNALQNAINNEMTITEISSEIFSRNMKSEDLHKLLAEMESSRLIVQEQSPTGGAPKTVVKLASALRKNELNEVVTIRSTHLNSLNSLIRTSETEIISFTEADFEMGNAL